LIIKYKPDVAVLEDAYYRPGWGSIYTLKSLSWFAGVVLEVSGTHNVPVEIMTATQARKWCCGDQPGEFKKQEVFDFFVKKYKLVGWEFKTHNDITDAMALFWGYREKTRFEEKNNTKEKGK
jgi:Holliday junction resolvasome RuvABC endonuclease subunit